MKTAALSIALTLLACYLIAQSTNVEMVVNSSIRIIDGKEYNANELPEIHIKVLTNISPNVLKAKKGRPGHFMASGSAMRSGGKQIYVEPSYNEGIVYVTNYSKNYRMPSGPGSTLTINARKYGIVTTAVFQNSPPLLRRHGIQTNKLKEIQSWNTINP